jgi:Protein of unknown function (DUF4238)
MRELHVNNHFVPECYLKRWEDSNHQICVYRTLVSHETVPLWKRYFTASIAYHRHLYTRIVSGKESDEVEKWFDSEYENPANDVLEKAILDQKLTVRDWHILINFLAAQDVRTPARLFEHMERSSKSLPGILEETLQKLKEKLESNESIDTAKHKVSERHSSLLPLRVTTEFVPGKEGGIIKAETYVGRSTWLYSIKHLLENTSKVLLGHKWTIVKPAKGFKWFTSDNPVVKLNFKDPQNYDLKGGWGKNKGNIFFPIGPEHAMFVQVGDKPMQKGTRLTADQTIFFRKIIAENAHRMIFADSFDNQVEKILPRLVDSIQFKKERTELEKWHDLNKKLEQEYYK